MLALAAAWAVAASPATAQDMRTEDVRFDPGASAATVRGTLVGREFVAYRVGAEAGQTMRVALEASNPATYFNVYPPGRGPGDEAIANSGLIGEGVPDLNRFERELALSGEYTISVYMMRSAARRGERSDYTLDVLIEGETGGVVQGDFADGLQGGPDFWEVRTSGGALSLRAGPSAGAAARGSFANGTILRNRGCRMAEGRRWCEVATPDDGANGWVAGDFLIEGALPAGAPPPEPATRTERIRFAPGTSGAVLRGELGSGEAVNYVLGAAEGQFLGVELDAVDPGLHFNIFAPGGDLLYDTQGGGGREYRGQLYVAGDHTVQVYSLGAALAAGYEVEFVIE